ncbi:predicted protein [Sparassis crispa]|uniref:TPR-like protein n=1 Tax=Sparassis crispa TaxID=139825 RepID=A0A401GUE4_9APHY|nr:predicted protein [Sparassis crispa]GBE85832.1 predicted protein [Sparassis crispa]
MAHPKDKHYWRQLREALTAGKWDISSPGRATNGTQLSWSELLRKFNKHCVGHTDVAELASQTQALSLLLSANSSDHSLDGNDVSGRNPLLLSQECMLPKERIEEATAGYNALKTIESSNLDSIKLAVAYYEYALRRPAECLATLAQAKVPTDVQDYTAPSGTARSKVTNGSVPGATSDSSVSSPWTGSVTTTLSTASVADISDGSSWAVTESIRSICLQGMSYEVISPDDPQTAFNAYLTASSLIGYVASEVPASVPQKAPATPSAGMMSPNTFSRYRELWRWVERLLRRAIILGSYLCDVRQTEQEGGVLWKLFDHYHTCSGHWPPTFRPELRSTIAVLHLRAFVLRYGRLTSPDYSEPASGSDKRHRWISAARSVIQEYRAILSISTQFPRARQRNVRVEDLVDLCVAIWEADGAVGEYAGWVIDVLWWATRLTFNSYRVFRHMSRLLYVSGDSELAKRTLRLYVQVVSKAREAGLGESEHYDTVTLGGDVDTDQNWVQALIHGARMLCRLGLAEEDGSKAVEEAKEAAVMIEKAKTRLDSRDKQLVASLQLAEGIWNTTMANIERDPRTRPSYFEKSLQLLLTSRESFSTPSVHYHLALAYARPGPSQDLQAAIGHARTAVEGDPGSVRHWHLLGLLLTAIGDWKAARGVLDIGAGVGETDLVDDPREAQESAQLHSVDGLHAQDFALSGLNQATLKANGGANGHPPNGHINPSVSHIDNHSITVLAHDATTIPPSATLLQPLPDHPPPSRQESFEHALQLRMTQLTLSEFVEGPEGAGEKWVEVFQWFSERREVGMDDRRMSIDSRRISEEFKAPSEVLSAERLTTPNMGERSLPTIPSSAEGLVDQIPIPSTPIPITVTPASPGITSPLYSAESSTPSQPEPGEELEKHRASGESNHRDMSRGKKVRQVLKSRVSKGQATITTISRKIGHNVGRHGSLHMKRSNSAPDLHAVLSQTPYQASSIHLRQHLSIYASQQDLSLLQPPPPPPPPPPPSQSSTPTTYRQNYRAAKDRRLLSNLWLMSAATFRRLGKIEQARAAIQEAEVRDENNPAVWVQLGLYYMALDNERRALEAFQKALFISPDDISATIHLCRLHLPSTFSQSRPRQNAVESDRDDVDLSVGLLSDLTRGVAWDVPEAWYFLAKHCGLQGRKSLERDCLSFALTLSEARGLRDIGVAVGWCL